MIDKTKDHSLSLSLSRFEVKTEGTYFSKVNFCVCFIFVYGFAYDRLEFDRPEVTLCGWLDVKIQLLAK